MSNYTRVERVFIGDGANVALPANTTLPTIAKGDLFLLDANSNIIPNVAAATAISKGSNVTVAMGQGNGFLRLSSKIRGNYTSAYIGRSYTAPTEQVSYVGFNAVTGTGNLSVADNTDYRLRIAYLDSRRIHGEKLTKDDFYYPTPVTGSSLPDLAFGIQANSQGRYNSNPSGTGMVSVEVVSNGTYTALAAGTISATNGSKVVTVSAGGHGIVAGDTIRIGGAGATFSVYKVASVNVNEITLTSLYQGLTASGLVSGKITVATAYGFKLTGLAVPANIPTDTYQKIIFTASFGTSSNDLNQVSFTTTTPMFVGNGYWEQVKDSEYFAQGNLGVLNRRLFPVKQVATYYTVGATYDTIVIEHNEEERADFQDTQNNPIQTTIYIQQVTPTAVGGEQGFSGGTTDFLAILNGYFAGSVGFPAITTF